MRFTEIHRGEERISGIAETRREQIEYGPRRAGVVVDRAINRGELPADTDPAAVVRTLIAPIYFQLSVLGEPPTKTTATQSAQIALSAAQAGVFSRSPNKHS